MESKADETRCMTLALSTLVSVTELGLSVDSGLGWIQGPDISDRAVMFQSPPKIFGTKYAQLADREIESRMTWQLMKFHYYNIHRDTFQTVYNADSDPTAPTISWTAAPRLPSYEPIIFRGEDVEDVSAPAVQNWNRVHHQNNSPFLGEPLVPNNLKSAQLQWLMENQWAQKAFLSSFSIALIDNAATFQHVRTLNIAKLSSRYLPDLKREDLWSALPRLEKLILFVSPDWRDVSKEPSGAVVDEILVPSAAAGIFHDLLEACIKDRKNLVNLDLGWIGGGERATGMFARNKLVMPAPVLDFRVGVGRNSAELRCNILTLPHVKTMKLTNCWFHPDSLKNFTHGMQRASLETLKLVSVSVTAVPRALDTSDHAGDGHVPQMGGQAAAQAFANALVQIQMAHANAGPPPPQPAHANLTGTVPPGGHLSTDRKPYREPNSSSLRNKQRAGSWPEIIDSITPGPTIDHQRYLHNLNKDCPGTRDPGSLRRIKFVSCGYIRLRQMRLFNQDAIPDVMTDVPDCLANRYTSLNSVMMSQRHDQLLGQVVPVMAKHESDTLQFAFGMRLGWEDNDMSKYDNREDAQPIGGSGRFSGLVKKSVDSHAAY